MSDLMDLLEPDDLMTIEDAASRMKPEALEEIITRIIHREIELLRDDRFSKDSEMKEITLWNIAALIAAIERSARVSPEITQAQTTQ